jgi:hypothetical protein
MAWQPTDSAIRMTAQLQEEISKASPDEIKAIFGRAALEQGLVERDSMNPQLFHATALADHAPQKFSKYVTINSTKYLLEGGSPEELAHAETSLYEQVLGQGDNGQARDAQGRFVAEPTAAEKAAQELEVANRAELELKFKRGDITAEAYLEQSGAINTYLTEHGILPEALTAVSDLVTQNTWAAATEQFLNSEAGADWPGGADNLALVTQILEQSPELMNQPPAEALATVWQYIKENNLALPNPETEAHHAISEASSVADIRAALGRPNQSSGMFDYR